MSFNDTSIRLDWRRKHKLYTSIYFVSLTKSLYTIFFFNLENDYIFYNYVVNNCNGNLLNRTNGFLISKQKTKKK